jgi:carboxymethylenebutenolidase
MCTTGDSRPPIEPISGAATDARRVTLRGEDGAEFAGYLARPEQGTGAGIVILPDVRGLHPFFEELAMRFAERGIDALAIDYFGRTAGTGERGNGFQHMPHVDQARWEHLRGDIRAAVEHLRSLPNPPRSTFTTGFCMGGRLASMSSTLGLGLAGAIPFYGWPTGKNRNGTPAPADRAGDIENDLLLFYGGADEGLPQEVRDEYDEALDEAGVKHETVVYPGAPHGFFDRQAEQFADAARDAWERTLAFIRRHTMGQPIAGSFGGSTASGASTVDDAADPGAAGAAADPRIGFFTGED